MPKLGTPEKDRLKKARLKKLSRLPKRMKLKRPSDPEEAKEWLRDVADHLSGWPNAGPPFRFVAHAIKRYLRGSRHLELERARNLLYRALELVEPPGRRKTFEERMRQRVRERKIVTLKQAKKPWHMITEEIQLKDKRSTKRIYEKTIKEKQLLELDRAMKEILDEESVQPRSS